MVGRMEWWVGLVFYQSGYGAENLDGRVLVSSMTVPDRADSGGRHGGR